MKTDYKSFWSDSLLESNGYTGKIDQNKEFTNMAVNDTDNDRNSSCGLWRNKNIDGDGRILMRREAAILSPWSNGKALRQISCRVKLPGEPSGVKLRRRSTAWSNGEAVVWNPAKAEDYDP